MSVTRKEALLWAQAQLEKNSDALLLLAHVLNCRKEKIIAFDEVVLPLDQWNLFQSAVARRLSGEPVAYITGNKEFWSLDFLVTKDCLTPRPETECLLEWVFDNFDNNKLSVLDLGTGSGAIACALAVERKAWSITATDISTKTLAIAKDNARRLALKNIKFLCSDLFAVIGGEKFSLIISNPPYIAPNDPHLATLSFEPEIALIADDNGYACLLEIIDAAPDFLYPGGCLLLEHGAMQTLRLVRALKERGFVNISTHTDYAGLPRFVVGFKE